MEAQEKSPSTFETTPPQPYIDRGPQLPEHYGDDKLVAMVRDPLYIFLYWELEGTLGHQARSLAGQMENWSLKVFCLSDGTTASVSVRAWARNWYLQVSPARRYRFELGYSASNGNFIPVVYSGEVETPRASPAGDLSQTWAHFFKDFSRGKLLKRRRKAPSRPKQLPPSGGPIPGLTPEIVSQPASSVSYWHGASPEVLKKEYIFRP